MKKRRGELRQSHEAEGKAETGLSKNIISFALSK